MATTNFVKTQSGKTIIAKSTGNSKQVFGKFLYEGELGILFGDSNTGKSILANDIAFFVCGGGHKWPGMTSPKKPSLYIDMEMTSKQYAARYHNAGDYMTDFFCRSEVNVLMCAEDELFSSIRAEIILQQAKKNPIKFVIIDNITNGFGSIFSASKMRKLISDLKMLKDRFGLTILLIAHCPKRKPNTPITDNDMGGSKMLINFCDSAFAIAPSIRGGNIKYIKQIKTRAGEKLQEVMTVEITADPYLCMRYVGMEEEDAHINPKNNADLMLGLTPQKEILLVQMLVDGNMTFSQIADHLSLKRSFVIDYALANNL